MQDAARASGFTLDRWQSATLARILDLLSDERGERRAQEDAAAQPDDKLDDDRERTPAARGVYLWGDVGRGKSWLLDRVFDALPTTAKRRVHFHAVARELGESVFRNRADPAALDRAAEELFGGAEVLYFDELHVHDVGTATLLTRLLERAVDSGITLLASSNSPPDALLPDPVSHRVFEPGIALIEQHMEVLVLDGPRDYRLGGPGGVRRGFAAGSWVVAPDATRLGHTGTPEPSANESAELVGGGHRFTARAVREREVWFDFAQLLEAPTSVGDYLAWCGRFDRWMVTDVPPLAHASHHAVQRFVHLVDVLCDLDLELHICSSAARSEALALERAPVDLARTRSRLALLREHVEDADGEPGRSLAHAAAEPGVSP